MKDEEQAKVPPNQEYLAKALEYLSGCDIHAAIDLYEEMYRTPGCDDWLLAQLGREDLFFLMSQLLRRPDIGHPWLYDRCREVEASPDGHLDLWSREHYKSTIITFGLTIQDILRDREITVGIFSHTRPIAKKFLLQIKTEFETNDDLKALYPDVLWGNPKAEAPKWSEDEGIIVRRESNPKESTVEAWGLVDGQPTSKHYRLLMYDDVVVRESVTTPDMIQKTTTALEQSYNLGAHGGIRRAVGTRWHYNDSYRTLLDRGTFKSRLYNGTVDNCGDIKKPVLITPQAMAEKRKDMGAYTFACQILQNPKQDATDGFQESWLEYWAPDKGRGLNTYILVDPANSKKEHADYTCMWVVGLGPDENFYVLAVIRDRLNLTERTNTLFKLHRTWKPLEVRYEQYGLQSDIAHMQKVMTDVKYRFKITPVGGKLSKPERIKRLMPLFEQGRIILPQTYFYTTAEKETKDMVHEFVEHEYKAYPVPLHDDMLDALARIEDTEAVGGARLTLKWPLKRPDEDFVVDESRPLDPAMGM